MTFDRFEIHAVLSDIETYLGYIRGNEMAADYLIRCHVEVQQHAAPDGQPTVNTELTPGYTFPCPEGQWKVAPHALLRRFTLSSDPSDPGATYQLIKSFEQGADEAWAEGSRWGAGLSAQAYDICQYIIQPDADKLAQATQSLLQDVSHKLLVTNQDWAAIDTLRLNWKGGSGYRFNKFYAKYADVVASMSMLSGKSAAGFAYAAQIVDQTQRGLLEHLQSVRDMLKDDLTAWVEHAQQPYAARTVDWGVIPDVIGIAQKATYILDYVPVVKDVKGAVEGGIGFVANTAGLATELGLGFPKKNIETPSSYLLADQVVEILMAALRDEYAQKFQDSLEQGFTGSWDIGPGNAADPRTGASELQNGWLKDLDLAGDWHLPELNSSGSMRWDGGGDPDRADTLY